MTSPSLLSDAQAREVARDRMRREPFVGTGEIDADFYRWAKANQAYQRAHPGDISGSLYDLAAYVAFHGERGPVESWSER